MGRLTLKGNMADKEQNHAADSGAFRQKGGPFDYSPECDEEKRREEALKSHDRWVNECPHPQE
jgi:hypothetical protein